MYVQVCVSLLFCNVNVYHFHYCSIWHGYTVLMPVQEIGDNLFYNRLVLLCTVIVAIYYFCTKFKSALIRVCHCT